MWKILSDENWMMMPNKCEKLSDKWWVTSDERWKTGSKDHRFVYPLTQKTQIIPQKEKNPGEDWQPRQSSAKKSVFLKLLLTKIVGSAHRRKNKWDWGNFALIKI